MSIDFINIFLPAHRQINDRVTACTKYPRHLASNGSDFVPGHQWYEEKQSKIDNIDGTNH